MKIQKYQHSGLIQDPNNNTKPKLWQILSEARDAKIGAVGAQQVRDSFAQGDSENASNLANQYLLANLSGLINTEVGNEFLKYGLLGGGLRNGIGLASSALGSLGLGKAGDYVDSKLNTNWMGKAGRVVGGFAGYGIGLKSTDPLLRRLAVKNITLHMPQDTFMNLRDEGFNRIASKVPLSSTKGEPRDAGNMKWLHDNFWDKSAWVNASKPRIQGDKLVPQKESTGGLWWQEGRPFRLKSDEYLIKGKPTPNATRFPSTVGDVDFPVTGSYELSDVQAATRHNPVTNLWENVKLVPAQPKL